MLVKGAVVHGLQLPGRISSRGGRPKWTTPGMCHTPDRRVVPAGAQWCVPTNLLTNQSVRSWPATSLVPRIRFCSGHHAADVDVADPRGTGSAHRGDLEGRDPGGRYLSPVWGFSASATERTAYSSGVADDKASALQLALALHLSAAVGGTPTLKAAVAKRGRSDGSTRAETASSASPCARPLSTATGSACSPARGSSQTPTPRRSSPRPPPSSCRSGTRWALNGQPARQPGCVRS